MKDRRVIFHLWKRNVIFVFRSLFLAPNSGHHQENQILILGSANEALKKTLTLWPLFFLRMGFNCLKATATSRGQFTFYHSVPRISWYPFFVAVYHFFEEAKIKFHPFCPIRAVSQYNLLHSKSIDWILNEGHTGIQWVNETQHVKYLSMLFNNLEFIICKPKYLMKTIQKKCIIDSYKCTPILHRYYNQNWFLVHLKPATINSKLW